MRWNVCRKFGMKNLYLDVLVYMLKFVFCHNILCWPNITAVSTMSATSYTEKQTQKQTEFIILPPP